MAFGRARLQAAHGLRVAAPPEAAAGRAGCAAGNAALLQVRQTLRPRRLQPEPSGTSRRRYSGPRVAAEPTVKHEPSRRAKGRQHPPGARCKCMFMEAKGRAGPPGGKCPPAPGAPGQEAAPGRAGRGAGPPSCAARGKWRRHAVRRRCPLRALSPSRRSGPCAAGGPAGPPGSAPITRVPPRSVCRRDARLAWKSAVKRRRCPSPREVRAAMARSLAVPARPPARAFGFRPRGHCCGFGVRAEPPPGVRRARLAQLPPRGDCPGHGEQPLADVNEAARGLGVACIRAS